LADSAAPAPMPSSRLGGRTHGGMSGNSWSARVRRDMQAGLGACWDHHLQLPVGWALRRMDVVAYPVADPDSIKVPDCCELPVP
jgi:hypothetical protein